MLPTLLIIDDELSNITSLSEVFVNEYNVRVATSGEEGIKAAKTRPHPSLILLDIVMPEMNGYEVCVALKSDPVLKHIPIIFVSGKASEKDELIGLETGAEDYVTKPFNPRLVQQRVKAHLHRYLAEKSLRENKRLYQNIVEQGMDAFVLLTSDRRHIVEFNSQAYEGLGYSQEEFKRLGLAEIQEPVSVQKQEQIAEILKQGCGEFEIRHLTKNQRYRNVLVSVQEIEIRGKKYFIDIWRDQTKQRQMEGRLKYLSLHDDLTNLPNRRQFFEHIEKALKRQKLTNEGFAVHYLDIDHFKEINDSLGNDIGDAVLRNVSIELAQTIRDFDLVARLGADEFAVLQTRISKANQAVILTDRIMERFDKPLLVKDTSVEVSVSLGVVVCADKNHSSSGEIIKSAESAVTLAREKGMGQYAFHTKSLTRQNNRRLFIGIELKKALEEKKELFLVYQPQVSIASSPKVIGVEALLRWKKDGQFISPGEFIPIAEERGIISQLGVYVLEKSCRQWRIWFEQYGLKLKLAVNVAPQEVSAVGYSEKVLQILENSGMPPEFLELEITERSFAMGDETVKKVMEELVDHGITFSIDDFGTGFSSLLYLKQLPVSKLKIAREFIGDMQSTTGEIVNASIAMAHGLGLISLAEGVEEEWQVDLLKNAGCKQIQGFYYYKPVVAEEVTQILTQIEPPPERGVKSKQMKTGNPPGSKRSDNQNNIIDSQSPVAVYSRSGEM